MKKYKTNNWKDGIEVVEVVRETSLSVFLASASRDGDRREAKKSEYHCYFDSWEEARTSLLERFEREVSSYESRTEEARKSLLKVKEMQKPV